MTSLSDQILATAVVQSATEYAIPEPDIAGAPVTKTVLSQARVLLQDARLNTQSILRNSATTTTTHTTRPTPTAARSASLKKPDDPIVSWLAHAAQVQENIKSSGEDSEQIQLHIRQLTTLRKTDTDTTVKASFIQDELQYLATLQACLETIKSMTGAVNDVNLKLDQIHSADNDNRQALPDKLDQDIGQILIHLVARIDTLMSEMQGLGPLRNTSFATLLSAQVEDVKAKVVDCVRQCWHLLFNSKIGDDATFEHNTDTSVARDPNSHTSKLVQVPPQDAIRAATDLGLLDNFLSSLSQTLTTQVLKPVFGSSGSSPQHRLHIDPYSVSVDSTTRHPIPSEAIQDLKDLINFLHSQFPLSVAITLINHSVTFASSELCRNLLSPYLPIELADYQEFQQLLDQVQALISHLQQLGPELLSKSSFSSLVEWKDTVHVTWLARTKAVALDRARSVYPQNVGLQRIVLGSLCFSNPEEGDEAKHPSSEVKSKPANDSVEDTATEVDAWGFDDAELEDDVPESDPTKSISTSKDDGHDEEEDAWGWNEDSPADEPSEIKNQGSDDSFLSKSHPLYSGPPRFLVSNVPNVLLDTIANTINNAIDLGRDGSPYSALVTTAPGLCSIPTLIISVFRATATGSYGLPGGGFLQHNDCIWLASQLRRLNEEYFSHPAGRKSVSSATAASSESSSESPSKSTSTPTSLFPPLPHISTPIPPAILKRLRLESDISTLFSFAQQAYTTEVRTHQGILLNQLYERDLLASVSSRPVQDQCVDSVLAAIKFLDDVVQSPWRSVLSPSANGKTLEIGVGGNIECDVADDDGRVGYGGNNTPLAIAVAQLYATLIDRVLCDITDLPDISEPDSRFLSDLCVIIKDANDALSCTLNCTTTITGTTVSSPSETEGGNQTPEHSVYKRPIPSPSHTNQHRHKDYIKISTYVPNWDRLAFMIQILAGSLSDITRLWRKQPIDRDGTGEENEEEEEEEEACLSENFHADEVISLIEALFAPSDLRAGLIEEIGLGTR